jgi:hypothetical protein
MGKDMVIGETRRGMGKGYGERRERYNDTNGIKKRKK